MIYISCQPDIPYFHWQVEVMLNNFQSIGIEKCHVVFICNSTPSREGIMLQNKFPQYNFFFYKDERELRARQYIPTIKPYGMLQHYSAHTIEEPVFYHDSDIIFTEKLDEKKLEQGDVWYLSDTISYIGSEYVISKGEEQFEQMCEIVEIDSQVVRENSRSSGGAQYVCKNATTDYWSKVYHDSYKLYEFLCSKEMEWKSTDYPIQKWCAEMWATLWNIWFFGYETEIDKELDFSFATSMISEMNDRKIMHNAGVTDKEKQQMFFKGDFILQDPFSADLSYVDSQYCSYLYKKAIDRVVDSRK